MNCIVNECTGYPIFACCKCGKKLCIEHVGIAKSSLKPYCPDCAAALGIKLTGKKVEKPEEEEPKPRKWYQKLWKRKAKKQE